MPSKLPNELVDAIISSIPEKFECRSSEERQALLKCAVVCRNWLPPSRRVLFSAVELAGPESWDSFVRWVVDEDEGRPWLASIYCLTFKDQWYRHVLDATNRPRGLIPEAISKWRGQYVVPVLAGRLPNLEYLSLRGVHWDKREPHPATFGMFAQFTALRQVRLDMCNFPSFSAFRRLLVSLPALKDLTCEDVHWPSAPQLSILSIQTGRPSLELLRLSLTCHSCALAVLEWLIHTPTRSTLVELSLQPDWALGPSRHQTRLPNRNLDYYAQIFGPSIRHAALDQSDRAGDPRVRISLSSFENLNSLALRIDGLDWKDVADMLHLLPARLDSLAIDVPYPRTPMNSRDHLIKEDGELRAMKTRDLELLEPVLSRDNFEGLRILTFHVHGHRDTLPSYRESTLEAIRRKLPSLHMRAALNIQLELIVNDEPL
ncbi:hypothetical protein GSI_12675 [Ganoderma sinense ZZ0214-1]|uniref:F-box domain-containing protein n=1 Tax=Ganoderma sinense ZZ0214-1 TaxID=1077348 RepID=A0A2G8RTG0_9APHY|nr:hypothetical protein GSI_12675 [Ganoderma sinense ZZ0214-1]